ncbi:riboflavin synthase [Helicobacter sp. MIT 05-5293]|uniref:riboflavin synthase n=1 Tax=Helicobacter sp. MIT 05-5293 TaxID=1548149 RepID=UPI00051DF17F|nr:riboflavin synthase [Helicobacter sp. MIT 05-5293]TLD79810.1 riboflavin synthase [Helicobacter sp. MIT 05-5293]
MFSGLVRQIAQIKNFAHHTLEVITPYPAQIGDSIAINGVCLTVVKILPQTLIMELSEHTQSTIAIQNFHKGAFVHLEPALKADQRLDGHIVQGHIDGTGEITKITHHSSQSDFWIQSTEEILSMMIPKGSVCIDGISLTITDVQDLSFKLTIIPHTLKTTLFRDYHIGRIVNIETDIITRSVVNTIKSMMREHKGNPQDSHLHWGAIDALQMSY